jgi:hypothetical protein
MENWYRFSNNFFTVIAIDTIISLTKAAMMERMFT